MEKGVLLMDLAAVLLHRTSFTCALCAE